MSRRSSAYVALPVLVALSACSSHATSGVDSGAAGATPTEFLGGGTGSGGAAATGEPVGMGGAADTTNAGSSAAAGASNAVGPSGGVPIIAGPSVDVPYQWGMNGYGIQGGAFLARSAMGTSSVVLDKTQPGKICLKGTVELVPTPADGSHPPYSTYWGIDLGFNLNQGSDSDPTVKTPWILPTGVLGFWFTVEGSTIPPLRFKTTPTGKDPGQEQDSCALVSPSSGVPNRVLFKDMYVQCWDGPLGTGVTNTSQGLLDVGLQVAAATDFTFPLDFCLTGFGVITE